MKKFLMLFVIVFSMSQVYSQSTATKVDNSVNKEDNSFRIPLIGEKAPAFVAESTNGTIDFPNDYYGKWKILFSHPHDFTPVCTTEVMELAQLQQQFDKLGVKLIVVSVDPLETHVQWKKAMENVKLNNREPVKINFPLVDDKSIVISKEYGMIHPATNSTKSVRGVFVIDPDNIIQAIYFYPMKVGRNTDEIIRLVSALQTTTNQQVMTPVNWKVGDDLLVANPPKVDERSPETLAAAGYYNPTWFLWYKKASHE